MEYLNIKDNILYIDGCNTVELAKEYGTPLYVMSENEIRGRLREVKEEFLDKYPDTRAAYASKAFLTLEMCKIIESEGFGLDVVSGGELHTAITAGFPSDRIAMHGNNKTAEELAMALDYGVHFIIINSMDEIDLIAQICEEKKKRVKVLFRINPEVSVNSHKFISTGHRDSKFGFTIDDEILLPAFLEALKSEYMEIVGFHFHLGSQLFDNKPYMKAVKTIFDLVKLVYEKHDFITKEINIGGGFGIKYTEGEKRPSYEYFLSPVMEYINTFCEKNDLHRPRIAIEPGRSIVGESGITLYSVGSIKDIPGTKKYVSVDGGMTDNIRAALYNAEYEGIIANKADEQPTDKVDIAGKCCESGDIIIRDGMFAPAEKGDILAVFSTGAYNYSMSNNYNKLLIPAVVMVRDGKSRVIVKRQTMDDLLRNDVM